MVRFGAHLATSMVDGWEEYYVRFEQLKSLAKNKRSDPELFMSRWRAELDRCSAHYDNLSRTAIQALLAERENSLLARRITAQLPGLCKNANRGYGETFMYGEKVLERHESFFCDDCITEAPKLKAQVLPLFEQRRVFGMLNVEALRKLVKKFEKYVSEDHAAGLYLELSLSNLANSVSTDFSAKLRTMIGECLIRRDALKPVPDLEEKTGASSPPKDTSIIRRTASQPPRPPSAKGSDDEAPKRTRSSASTNKHQIHHQGPSQFDQLCKMVRSLDENIKNRLVSHRGFHSKRDELNRPLENTLTAYEQSWASGLLYCECDINLTLDGRIVLCHDDDLKRLARDPSNSFAYKPVTKLTFEELYALPLKNGTSAPLLEDVLRTATRAGPEAGLVIEIKSGADGAEVAAALCKLLVENPKLLSKVAVVMSFDLYIIHNFNNFFNSSFEEGKRPDKVPKILFLTCDKEIEDPNSVEMQIDWTMDPVEIKSIIKNFIVQGNSILDGIYVQFNQSMRVENHQTAKLLRELCESYVVGVWGYTNDPDDLETVSVLAGIGVNFINTDLPEDFAPDDRDDEDDEDEFQQGQDELEDYDSVSTASGSYIDKFPVAVNPIVE